MLVPPADFDKGFPTDLDKPPYTGDPPTQPNFGVINLVMV